MARPRVPRGRTMKEAALPALVVASIVAAILAAVLVLARVRTLVDSKQTLKALWATRAIAVAPPGATEIGSAHDPGSKSSITGHDPVAERIFATAQTISDVVSHYERTYPGYRFTHGGLLPKKQLFGRDGWAYVTINISPGQPDLAFAGLHVNLSPAPGTATTYVVVVASGHKPTRD